MTVEATRGPITPCKPSRHNWFNPDNLKMRYVPGNAAYGTRRQCRRCGKVQTYTAGGWQ